ncbi:GDSL-type esterase/lipase family protein [Spirochaeta cellobiosiphila]|uniref:GDSL-type esterase/lipase family protein n=1 Tax=Spirochaeta cellobiosiphila TaxID=504483 RepID=UPI000490F854|nr:GDSL-type esterase/lipase family protein [Spirochaeta cellobiosiphila]
MTMRAMERSDDHHREKHDYFLGLSQKENFDIVFFGDSLTRRWEDYPDVWNKYWGTKKALNMGVGGDTLENMLWRIENGELQDLNPSLFILLMGTNNLPLQDNDYIIQGIKYVVMSIHSSCPSARILLQGLYPRSKGEEGQDYMSRITIINEQLKLWSRDPVFYIDPGVNLLNPDATVDYDIMPDGLHLNDKGYDKLAPQLIKAIKEIEL